MNIQTVRYVIEIEKTRNFSQAAQNLFVTESSLSQAVRKLEKELNTELFIRSTRKVSLTPAGAVFMEYAEPFWESYEKLNSAMQEFSPSSTKELHVGIADAMRCFHLPIFFKSFMQEHNDILIHFRVINPNEIMQELEAGNLNWAILKSNRSLLSKFPDHSYQKMQLKQEYLYAILSEDFPADSQSSLHLSALKDIPVIVDGLNTPLLATTRFMYAQAQIPLKTFPFYTNDIDSLFESTCNGEGYIMGTKSFIDYYKNKYRFSYYLLEPKEENNTYLICRKNYKPNRYDHVFIKALKEWCHSL